MSFVGAGWFAIVVTFLVTVVFYASTLHLAALWILGDVPHQRAVAVAPIPSVIVILFSSYGPLVVMPLSYLGAAIAIRQIYRLKTGAALLLTTFHFAIAAILGLALVRLVLG